MIKLFVTRHGKAICNENGLAASVSEKHCGGLSELGKKQAEELLPELLKNEYDVIITSPMIRAYQTLWPYLRTFTRPPKIVISDLVLERDLGDLRGKTLVETKKFREDNNVVDRVSWLPPNGESILDVYERVKKFIEYLKDNFEDKSVLVCSHSVFLRTLDIFLNNGDIKSFYDYPEPEHGVVKKYLI
jgi:broad specificity phosphatase PhoE